MNPEGGRSAVGATHARRSTVAEKPIKVDETTDRVVTELAFFFRTTKKSVVATAVAEYASRAEPHRTPRPGLQPPTVLDLAPLDRLALRRDELVRAFEVRHARDIRLAELEPEAMGASQLVLLAETDPIVSGASEETVLSRIASDLLQLRVEVQSLTTLRLFAPSMHRAALELSRPL
jgi:hypothetical protein